MVNYQAFIHLHTNAKTKYSPSIYYVSNTFYLVLEQKMMQFFFSWNIGLDGGDWHKSNNHIITRKNSTVKSDMKELKDTYNIEGFSHRLGSQNVGCLLKSILEFNACGRQGIGAG